jgi:nucleoside-diphosphate-sugar epimerase
MLLVILLLLIIDRSTAADIACVTGASGYLGTELTSQLLNLNYHVRGTVRDPSNEKKTKHLRLLPFANERLKLIKADLLGGADAFTECVEGADILFHTASPFITTNINDPMKDLVEPALHGTENAVRAALKSNSVKKIVITSSIAATMSSAMDKDGDCFTQTDWNKKSTLTSGGLDAYRYSKTIAEKKFWELLQDENLNPRRITGATINPSFIVGPPRNTRTDGESTTFMFLALSGKLPYRGDTPMCDVRDVALAHIKAATVLNGTFLPSIQNKDVSNYRYIVSSPRAVRRASVLSWLSERYSKFKIVNGGTIGKPSHIIFCPSNMNKLGMEVLTDPKVSIIDMAESMIKLGSVAPNIKTGVLKKDGSLKKEL